ncbi:B3 DNA binding domain-containing protein [Dioscorea alata]|uniref:B3 DNA binding domain-containing protein n=1 Tax=Dioscorea alata TaxID=55571 RepID=A0ACB7WVX9_DIOAL|nr:B3 DNA binding domain-containing protein [Dioscorea alata]
MKERCKPCKEFEEHFYWNHFKLEGMSFIKVMDFSFSQGMLIPEKFVKNVKRKLPEIMSLRSPNGNLWSVKLEKVPGSLMVKDGWKEFVNEHYVVENDVLVFKYDGNSCFDVLIFDQSGCEKEASYFVRRSNPLEEHEMEKEFNKTGTLDVQKNGTNAKRRNTENEPGSSKIKHDVKIVTKRRQISKEEEARALQLAEAYETLNPSFITVMQPSHVSQPYFMTVPYHFVSLHMNRRKRTVILRIPKKKKEWHVKFHCSRSWGFRGQQWQSFVFDNNIEEGDACVFELISAKSEFLKFDVHIFRAVAQVTSLSKINVAVKPEI